MEEERGFDLMTELFTSDHNLKPQIRFENIYFNILDKFKDDSDSKRKMKFISDQLLKSFESREIGFMDYTEKMDEFSVIHNCFNHAYNIDS